MRLMRNIFGLSVLLVGGYLGYVVWRNQPHPAANAIPPAPDPVSATQAAPVAAPPIAAAAPAPHRLAPPGVYYLRERVSVTTDTGVTGISPGTRVIVLTAGTPMRVTDGQSEFTVMASQVTNDMDLAAQLGSQDREAQAALWQAQRAPQGAIPPPPPPEAIAAAAEAPPVPAAASRPVIGDSNPLDKPGQFVNQPDGYDAAGHPRWRSNIH